MPMLLLQLSRPSPCLESQIPWLTSAYHDLSDASSEELSKYLCTCTVLTLTEGESLLLGVRDRSGLHLSTLTRSL